MEVFVSRYALSLLAALLLGPASALAQTDTTGAPPRPMSLSLSGPRMGITVLTGESARIAREDHGVDRPVVTQFGWQFERRFLHQDTGPSGVFEWVFLVGGLEQGAFFPSLSWITGVRTPSGIEVGAGPNITPLGLGFAVAGGISLRSGYMQFPINVALVSSENGVRTSALVGFTTRR
jgi:hypothetical protein